MAFSKLSILYLRCSFANWLDRVYAGSGFSWRSLAAQRETFVFA